MGLIKAIFSAAGSTFADEWKDYIYCDSIDEHVLVTKGKKKGTKGTSNTKGSADIISAGSIIAINNGQAMAIVEDGKIIEYCDEPGSYTFDDSVESSIFASSTFSEGIKKSFEKMGRRTTFGGGTGRDQRVYYFNLKEISDCKFGTSEPVMYDDPIYQFVSVRFFGNAVLRLVDPIKFYTNVSGNIEADYYITNYWGDALRNEFIDKLSTALAKLALDGIKFSQIPQNQDKLTQYMNEVLDTQWFDNRGLIIQNCGIGSISLDPSDKAKVNKIDEMRLFNNPQNAAGRLVAAQANAMESAASNTSGAINGFMGMGFANQAGNATGVNNLYEMGEKQTKAKAPNSLEIWTCKCGASNTGKFCYECGEAKPESNTWKCPCGVTNTGNFCSECGTPKPTSKTTTCECGTVNTGKFCSNCGKIQQ